MAWEASFIRMTRYERAVELPHRLKSLCGNLRTRPSAAKATLIARHLRHGCSRALTKN